VKFYHFWPKNDDENWSRKNIFEIPPCACRNFKNIFNIIERRIFIEIVEFSNENDMFCAWSDFKKICDGCTYDK
jgi:hypothetical protein